MDIHEKIRKLLQDANMTPTQVAKALELKQPSVYSWCNGDPKPSKTSIMKLSKLFNVDPSYLLSESAAENGKKMAQYQNTATIKQFIHDSPDFLVPWNPDPGYKRIPITDEIKPDLRIIGIVRASLLKL